jgi:HEAT repeat protein
MRFVPTLLIALLVASGTASAQTPPESTKIADREHSSKTDRAPTADEELALAALEGLMAQPAERALPIIKKVLAGSQTPLVKRRALFVLSQIDSPEAKAILAQTARSPDAGMRGEAIRSIGIGGDPKLLESLQEIYKAGDSDLKHQVLETWLIAGRKDLVYQAVLNAKSDEEANEAIRILGAMGATDELRKLGDRPNTPSGLVDAYAISGDIDRLRKIAEGASEHSLRVEATQKIGIIQSDAARAALRDIYSTSKDEEIRNAALQGMLIARDEEGVLALYRAAKTSEEKRALLRMLSMMDGDAALKAIDAALEKK